MSIQKKQAHGRIILTRIRNGREETFHATKGWRSYRIGKPTENAATRLIAKIA